MWKTKLAMVCVLAAGCKSASVDEQPKKEDPAATTTTGTAGRSGKVDLGKLRPSLESAVANGSAAISDDQKARIEDRRNARIAQFDSDGDGKINAEERKHARRKSAEDMRKQADANGDGKVTTEELAKTNFRRLDPDSIDVNKDGDVSTDEVVEALEARTRAWGNGARPFDPAGRFGGRLKARSGSGSAAAPAQP